MPDVITPEQVVADWFKARLLTVTKANGYSIDLPAGNIFVDHEAPEESPPVPRAEYDDSSGSWGQQSRTDSQRTLTLASTLEVTIPITKGQEKKQGRLVRYDLARACSMKAFDADKPMNVMNVQPTTYARSERIGGYITVTVIFTVQVDDRPAT